MTPWDRFIRDLAQDWWAGTLRQAEAMLPVLTASANRNGVDPKFALHTLLRDPVAWKGVPKAKSLGLLVDVLNSNQGFAPRYAGYTAGGDVMAVLADVAKWVDGSFLPAVMGVLKRLTLERLDMGATLLADQTGQPEVAKRALSVTMWVWLRKTVNSHLFIGPTLVADAVLEALGIRK